MKKIIVFLLFFSSMTLFAQPIATKTVIKYSESGKIKEVAFSKDDNTIAIPQSPEVFFREFLKTRENDEFRKNTKVKLEEGHQTFEQYYKGVKVCNGGYSFHYDVDGIMEYAHGNYIQISDINITPSISSEKAKNIFVDNQGIKVNEVNGFSSELLIRAIYNKTNRNVIPILVYKIVLKSNSPNNNEIGYINAHTGKVEETEPRACYVNSMGTFVTRYQGTKYANTDYLNNTYRLYDGSRGAAIHTMDMQANSAPNYWLATEITDLDNNWHYNDFYYRKDMGLDVHWALQRIYDRLSGYGKNSFDNNGKSIDAFVNAYIGFDTDNAAWYSEEKILCFGIGLAHPRPFSSMDIVAHEYGHGISSYQIDWGSDSKHLSEGLSDIWGVIMDYHWGANDSQVWRMGENVFSANGKNCARDIQNPSSDSAYNKMASRYLSTDYISNNGIYYRSGVFSHWFYLLVNGGNININGNMFSFAGVGMDTAERLIVKTVYNSYLRYCNDYPDVRDAFIAAAKTMDVNGLVNTVCNAWFAVGVGDMALEDYFSISGPTIPCDVTRYYINSLPTNFRVEWAFQDSLSPVSNYLSYNPTYSYECSIDNTIHTYFNEVMEARIFNNGQCLGKISKPIRTGDNFTADMVSNYDNPPVLGGLPINQIWTVIDGGTYNINHSGTLTLTSSSFWNATVTEPNSFYIQNWQQNGNQITFRVYSPISTQTVCISGQDGCESFRFYLRLVSGGFFAHPSDFSVEYNSSSKKLNVSLDRSHFVQKKCEEDVEKHMHLTVTNVMTGYPVYDGGLNASSVLIDTSGWESGTYVVGIRYMDSVITKKIVIY